MSKPQYFLIFLVLIFCVSIGLAQETPTMISFGVINDKAVSLPDPPYPAAARAIGAKGAVNVQVVIDEAGNVISAEAISGHPLLRAASERAARAAKFRPVLFSGNPVKVSGTIVYDFGLQAAAKSGEQPKYAGKTISGGVVNGKAISLPVPQYPAAAKAVGANGAVNVQVLIDEAGNVVSAEAVSGHPLLRSASEKAAREARFSPTLHSGSAVKVSGIIVYNFSLPQTNNYEEQLKYMLLGVALTISDMIPPEEWETFETADLDEIPDLEAELKPLVSITTETSLADRAPIVNRVSTEVRNKLTGAEAWQFKLGELFGKVMIEVKRPIDGKRDQSAVKANLAEMRDLLAGVPEDFPPEILQRFTKIANYADAADFYSDENLVPFMELITDMLNIISPD